VEVHFWVGDTEGEVEGPLEGDTDGESDGVREGEVLGEGVGALVGSFLIAVGELVGSLVGGDVHLPHSISHEPGPKPEAGSLQSESTASLSILAISTNWEHFSALL
jgi:hypothetical protein